MEKKSFENIDKLYQDGFVQAIACHHVNIKNYISNNYLPNDHVVRYVHMLQYFNFIELYNNNNLLELMNSCDLFVSFCTYDYLTFADFVLNDILNTLEMLNNDEDIQVYQDAIVHGIEKSFQKFKGSQF